MLILDVVLYFIKPYSCMEFNATSFVLFLTLILFVYSCINVLRFIYRLYSVIKTEKGTVTNSEEEIAMFSLSASYLISYIIFLFI